MSGLRIAYCSASTIPSRQANSVHVMRMCQALARAGHEVLLVAQAGASDGRDEHERYGVEACFDIALCRGGRSRLRRLRYPAEAVARVRRWGGVELAYGRHLRTLVPLAASNVPVVYESHEAPTRLLARWERRLFAAPGFRRLVVISEALRRDYAARYPGRIASSIMVAPDAADAPVHAAAALGATRGRLQVGYVGHLYPGKGMEVVARLAPRCPDMDFHVVGGTDRDLERWRRRTETIDNLVLHGFVAPGETDRFRLAMDVLLAPYQQRVAARGGSDISRWMSPLKLFEYMAARRAIVASDLPVLREVLRDGVDAVLVPPDDIEAWAEALRRLADPAPRAALADAAHAAFTERYSWATRARRVLEGLETAA